MKKLHPLNLILKRLDERSEHEQLEFLEIQKSIIVRDIGRHREQVQSAKKQNP